MAANPAHELADLLESLRTDQPVIAARRAIAGCGPEEVGFWHWHTEALAKVKAFEDALAELDDGSGDGEDYGPDFASWYRAIWEIDSSWGTNPPRNPVTDERLRSLRMLGRVLDRVSRPTDFRDPAVVESVVKTLQELLDVLEGAQDDDPSIVELRVRIGQALRFAQNITVVGPSAALILIEDVLRDGSVLVAEHVADERLKSRLQRLLMRLASEVTVNVAATGIIAGGSALLGALPG